MTRPRIALTLSAPKTLDAEARAGYIAALERAGAEVIALDPGDKAPDHFDGLCLSGGGDVAPARYDESDPGRLCDGINESRDELELALTALAQKRDLPVLGLCRGFQVLNVAFGGKLLLHVEGHRDQAGKAVTHVITPAADSLLAAACGTAAFAVNSHHHQAVDARTLAPGLRATACAGDIIEAIESIAHRWIVGVQWHPERVKEVSLAAGRIFAAFAAVAAERR